ncbi:MAG: DNA repair protein RadC [Bacilli bacterium]|nr:DNA repair protein RadC [Bacilli bacterium]
MIKFKNLPDYEKPRERLFLYGSESLSNEELISIILKTGSREYSVKEVALNLLTNIGDISKLSSVGINTLMKIPGIGKVKAIEIKAAIELGRRVYNNNLFKSEYFFLSSLDVYNYFRNILINKKQEFFYCLYMDTKKRLIDKKCLFIGTLNMSLVSIRDIFREAYLLSASCFICVHNHPSGDSSPSNQDKLITKKLMEVGNLHEVILIDHVIIGSDNYYSFMEENKFFVK